MRMKLYYLETHENQADAFATFSLGAKSPTHSPNCADTKLSRFLGSGRITGNPHLTRHWPFGERNGRVADKPRVNYDKLVCVD
jgi:hypothetical protein